MKRNIIQKLGIESLNTYSGKLSIQTYRMLCLIATVLIIYTAMVYKRTNPGSVDPMSIRIMLALACLVLIAISYFVPFVQRQMHYFVYGLAYSIMAWLVWLVAINNFTANYAVALMMAYLSISLIFRNSLHLAFYLLIANSIIEFALLNADKTELNGLLFVSYTAGAGLVFFLVLNNNIIVNDRLVLNKEYIATIFNNSPEALLIVDSDTGEIFESNAAGIRAFGAMQANTLAARSLNHFFAQTMDWTEFVQKIKQTRFKPMELHLKTLQGADFWANMVLNRVKVLDQKILIVQIADITQQRTAQELQFKLNKQLENANNELSNMLYVTSHDLKTPLRSIGTLATWIADDLKATMSEESKEQIRLLTSKVKRLYSLVDNLAVYAKITKDEHQLTRVNVKELLLQLEKNIVHNNTTRIEIEGTFEPVKYNKEMLEQVFYHLLSNAIKFIDKPFGIIYVRAKEEETRWVYSVADNGVGIDKVYFDKIFQPFQKVGTQNDSDIVGFGLTIVKKIVETFGGELWLESEPEAGTTFFFTVPK